MPRVITSLALSAALFLPSGLAQAATMLSPDSFLDNSDYETNEVPPEDPTLFETLLETVSISVNEKRDGLLDFGDDFEVIEDLFDVTVTLLARVWRGNTGLLTFGYDLSFRDDSGGGDGGSLGFSVAGFAGYDLAFSYIANNPFGTYVPFIERSADGDSVEFTYFDPRDPGPLIETFLLTTEAETYALDGTGILGVEIFSFGTTNREVSGLPVPSMAPSTVPLPAALPLLLAALAAFGFIRRRG